MSRSPKPTDVIGGEVMENEVETAVAAGMSNVLGHEFKDDAGNTWVRTPEGYTWHEIGALNPKLPEFVTQAETQIDQDSFNAYVTRFKTVNTVIFAHPFTPSMTAVLDYHGESDGSLTPATANHHVHVSTFACEFDEDWKRWREIDRREIGQYEFACFIEEMLHTIGEPDGADLLDMAANLKINRGIVMKSTKRLDNGTIDVEYREEDTASTAKTGSINLPDEITIVAPIYMLREAQAVVAKLRYRVEKGEPLRFRIDILNRKTIELEAFRVMAGEVAEATGCPVYLSK